MFWTRLISGVILVALALLLIIPGGTVLLFSMMCISLVGMYELYRIMGIEKSLPGYMGYALAV
ncbi:MAG: phosphatidate cytidylyltransferase, partial [Lachnospiraceae bacterium]|nr:phosphatidate cytidylyltransferase [Lachnospiraceae bacterium]